MKRYICFTAVSLLLMISCQRWNVNELKKNILFEIPAGTEPGEVNLKFNNEGYVDLTFDVRVSNGKVFCSDNIAKRLQIFNLEGQPLMAIGDMEDGQVNNLIMRNFSFGVIGNVISDQTGNVFVQNTILPGDRDGQKVEVDSATGMSPSYILVFNNDGRIMYSLGQNGTADVPFYSIYNMFTDERSRLFVISKSYDNWSVFRYDGKERDFALHLDKNYFKEKEKNENLAGRVENIIIFKNGEKLLISVAYYDNVRFKYRKIYEYKIIENRLGGAVIELPDPRNELFSLLEDKYIILWDVEKRDIRFTIWSLQENIINNLLIQMQGPRPFYEKVLVDEMGRLYTMIVFDNSIEIKEWK
ncbi:MAG TPA: hypothetical protein P5123_01915 [Spirochaetota bacterium]|nr:hypothetical protein [Spirochaetota bacterium]